MQLRWSSLCALMVCLLYASWAPAEVVIYVSPDGNDRHPGTLQQPLASVAAAQQLARQARAADGRRDVTVILRGGTYWLDEPLVFTPEDTAGEGAVSYVAHPGEAPILSGGAAVTGWRQRGKLLEAVAPAALQQGRGARELFIAGRRAVRARTPNEGFFRVAASGEDRRTSFFFDPADAAAFRGDLRQAEVVYLHDWSTSRIAIRSADLQKNEVFFQHPIGCNAPHYAICHFEPHPRYFLEGGRDMLDAPGEWFLDERNGTLLYHPREGETAELLDRTAVVPRLRQLLVVRGDEATQATVRGLRFAGLTFAHCRWDIPAEGFAAGQASVHEPRDGVTRGRVMIPAAITFDLADDCVLEDCRIAHVGGSGVWLRQQAARCRIVGCHLDEISGNGINIGETFARRFPAEGNPGWQTPYDDLCSYGNVVEGCVIERCGAQFVESVAVWVGITPENRIQRNVIREMPYTGVSVGWSWNTSPTPCRGNEVRENRIYRCMLVLSDGGGIYTLGRQPGAALWGNLIYDIPRNEGRAESNGIFMDEGSTELLVDSQVIYGVDRSPIRFHRAVHVHLRNNVLVTPADVPPFRYNAATAETMTFEANAIVPAAQWQAADVDAAVRRLGLAIPGEDLSAGPQVP